MKINHNITAQIANVNLKKDERKIGSVLQKLSSGYKITKASDDSAGLAISNKMRTQIRALEQSSRNAEDGRSIIETADAALGEVTNILQRIRELSVQAANDTYTIDDRVAAQDEIDQLLDEVDRISSTTEFNGKKLLDGSSSRAFVCEDGTNNLPPARPISVSMEVPAGDYKFKIDAQATQASVTFNLPTNYPAEIMVNDVTLNVTSAQDAQTKILETCDKMNMKCQFGAQCKITTNTYGSDQKISVVDSTGTKHQSEGRDAKITLYTTSTDSKFESTAKYTAHGNSVVIRDNGGFEMRVELANTTGDVNLHVYNAGYMDIQIGANEHQNLSMNFAEVSCNSLGLRDSEGNDTINVCTRKGADNSILKLDDAIKITSAARAELGAYQNRLESTKSSLDVSSYNMTNAMSRIMDTDMADAMTEYTQLNVLQQAATSMLSQANSKPEQIMSILQGM
ncbi:MAG: flagellar hook-associated protein FlgL [Lachnospiraceae bacterium]|nr:flagellar hook-associated protein FlgL [Lachnospiraceae bacterium]